jgi:hypothetical protein
MIQTEQEYETTLERVAQFQRQVEHLRLSASGYLSELDRMLLEVREYLWSHPAELSGGVRV